ncbi:hypothetical protein EXIGLDRAFT_263388 [Exidia glandulosa HHB12029]|uniref:Transmembrane protein n=1 Tax=Exidia glandulosa HHB12029 TaxID=1314781 RepID=A0A165DRW4_EXIGL|nr:hypothetical protein EXIGLDRAFT_263388 [Exidia glandulosa HHB12029]
MASSSVRTATFACRGDRPMAGATSAMSVLHPLSAFKTFSRNHSNAVNRRYSCRLGCTSCFTPSTRRRTSRRLQLMYVVFLLFFCSASSAVLRSLRRALFAVSYVNLFLSPTCLPRLLKRHFSAGDTLKPYSLAPVIAPSVLRGISADS